MTTEILLGLSICTLYGIANYLLDLGLTNLVGHRPANGTPLHASVSLGLYLLTMIFTLAFAVELPTYLFFAILLTGLMISSAIAHLASGPPVDKDHIPTDGT